MYWWPGALFLSSAHLFCRRLLKTHLFCFVPFLTRSWGRQTTMVAQTRRQGQQGRRSNQHHRKGGTPGASKKKNRTNRQRSTSPIQETPPPAGRNGRWVFLLPFYHTILLRSFLPFYFDSSDVALHDAQLSAPLSVEGFSTTFSHQSSGSRFIPSPGPGEETPVCHGSPLFADPDL